MVDISVLEGTNFTFSHIVRDNGRGGGVGVLFTPTYTLMKITPINSQYFEGLTVTLKNASYTHFTIAVMYIPPSAPIQSFFEPFNSLLQETYGNNVIICGDFNIYYNNTRYSVTY